MKENTDQELILPDAESFQEQLAKLISENELKYFPLYIVTFYFRHFKPLTNSLGTVFSEKAALELGTLIKENITSQDYLGRLTPSTFILLTRNKKTREEFENFLQNLCYLFHEPITIQHHSYIFAPSVGITVFPGEESDPLLLIDQSRLAAQYALDENLPFAFYSNAIERKVRLELYMRNEVTNLIHRQGYDVYYQPQYSAQNMEMRGFEVSLNVQMPAKRIISNEFLLAKAEEINLIDVIEKRLLREAFPHLRQWNTLSSQPFQLLLTACSSHLINDNLTKYLEQILPETNLPPSSITIEVKEDRHFKNAQDLQNVLINLSQLGVKIAINKMFGFLTTLYNLNHLTVSTYILEGSLLSDPPQQEKYFEIIKNVFAFCKSANINALVRKIQTQEQLAWAKELGADIVQGDFLNPPEPSAKIKKQLLGMPPKTAS